MATDHTLKFVFLCMAAAGIAAINSVGNLGGLVAQNVAPWIKDETGSTIAPMFFLAACLAATGVLVIVVGRYARNRETVDEPVLRKS